MTFTTDRSGDGRPPHFVRHAALVVGCAIVAAVVAAILSLTREPTYEASTRILIQRATSDTTTGTALSIDPARVLQTEALVVTGREVRSRVKEAIGRSPAVRVEPVAQSDVLAVVAESSVPEDAARFANAYASAYIDFRRDDAQRQLSDELLDARRQLFSLNEAIDAEKDQDRLTPLQDEREAQRRRLANVLAQLASTSPGASVLNRARSTPVGPAHSRDGGAAPPSHPAAA